MALIRPTQPTTVVDSATQRYLIQETAAEVSTTISDSLARYHQANPLKNGLSKEEIRSGFKRTVDQKVFSYCLNELIRKKEVVQEESVIRLAGHTVALKADEKKLKQDLIGWYQQKGLTTATIKETYEQFADYPESLVREVLELLLKEGSLVKVSESLYFSADHLVKLQDLVVDFIRNEGEIDAPRFKTLSGLTRKFSIPIMEYFDRMKLTIRVGDKRILRKKD